MARTVALVLAALVLALQSASYPICTALDNLPRLVLWAWERPTDLRGLGGDTAVAFLAQTVVVTAGRVDVVPRRQALRVDADTPLISVTRVEVPGRDPAALTPEALDRVARAIVATAETPRIAAVQIDFDATGSQRRAYRDLLHRVRAALDPSLLLSMTALASWCAGDAWLDGLPVDEAVPMLFRMGPSAPRLQNGVDRVIRAPECRGAIGTALDEPVAIPAGARRTYVFNPHPWSDSSIAAARRLASARSRS